MTTTHYLLIPLIIFVLLLYPLLRKALSLLEIVVGKYVQEQKPAPAPIDFSAAKTILNLKLQAYERIILFVERIKPDSLIPRAITPTLTNKEFHILLISEIRNEFEYNLSQQLYLGENTWNMVNDFKNNIITLINTAAADCTPTNPSGELAKKILEQYISSNIKPDMVLKFMKTDIAEK